MKNKKSDLPTSKLMTAGFTIVELLIVIVVIGILAALVMTAMGGVQKEAGVRSDLANAGKAMEVVSATAGAYPSALPSDFRSSPGTKLTLAGETSSIPGSWTVGSGNIAVTDTATGETAAITLRPIKSRVIEKTSSSTKMEWTFDYSSVDPASFSAAAANYTAKYTIKWGFTVSASAVNSLSSAKVTPLTATLGYTTSGPDWLELQLTGAGLSFNPSVIRWSLADYSTWSEVQRTGQAAATPDKYCINGTHESYSDIQFRYDSEEGLKEGACAS